MPLLGPPVVSLVKDGSRRRGNLLDAAASVSVMLFVHNLYDCQKFSDGSLRCQLHCFLKHCHDLGADFANDLKLFGLGDIAAGLA